MVRPKQKKSPQATSAKEKPTPAQSADDITSALRLKLLLKFSFMILLLESIMILLLGHRYPYAITASFLDQSTFRVTVDLLATINSSTLIAFGLLVSAALYFVMSTTGYGTYLKDVTKGNGRFRWVNYGLSNMVIIMFCAIAVGFGDALQLVLISAIVLMAAMLGYIHQVINLRRKRIVWDGQNAMIAVIVMLMLSITLTLAYGSLAGVNHISWASVLPLLLFAIYQGLFILGLKLHYLKRGWFSSKVNTEIYLIGTSTVMKLLIAVSAVLSISALSLG